MTRPPDAPPCASRRGVRRGLFCVSLLLLQLLAVSAVPVLSDAGATQQGAQDAIELLENRQFSSAVDLLLELRSRSLNPDQYARLLAYAYLGTGFQALDAGEFAAARDLFRESRRYDGEDVRSWQGEALTWFREGRYAEAAALLDQALVLSPGNAGLYHQLGAAYYAEGRMAEAVDALSRAQDLGNGKDTVELLEKVRREWQLEQEMAQEVRGHFQLSFVDGAQSADLAKAILETLEDAYAELGADLAYYPDVRVPVLLYSKKDFADVTGSPDWAGGAYDGKIRLPLGGLSRMNDQLAAVLYHEYAHVLVHFLANRRAPIWLNEGLAELAGRRRFSAPAVHLARAVHDNLLLNWDTLAQPFSRLPAEAVPLAYEQSGSLTGFMVESFGWHKIAELLEELGKGGEWQTVMADVYRDYGMDWPAILGEWQAGLKR